MGRAVRLEEFTLMPDAADAYQTAGQKTSISEDQKLSAYEHGYKAGWDDSVTSQSSETSKLSSDLASNLRDLSFTFHEARAHVLKGVEPLIRQIVSSVLPDLASEALPNLVLERLEACLASAAEPPVTILVAPDARAAVEQILPSDIGFPVVLREEPTLASGQVFLRTGQIEEAIDTSAAVTEIQAMVGDFFTINERLQAHG